MPTDLPLDDALIQRLPLPLAQLLRRAVNAKTDVDRILTAYSVWEAGLKLLASVAVVTYAGQPEPNLSLTDEQHLNRPSNGNWWALVRLLVPRLAKTGAPGFGAVRDSLFGEARSDMQDAAHLDALL